jgi:hypothetical protein
MPEKQPTTWGDRWDGFARRHPWLLTVILLGTAFLAAPLMVAASKVAAVLYQDF